VAGLRANFRRYSHLQTLRHLSHWLEFEIQVQIDITGSGPGRETNEREGETNR